MKIPKRDLINEGEQDYEEWRATLTDTPSKKANYEAMAAKSDLWLQLAEALDQIGEVLRDQELSLEELIESGREERGKLIEEQYGIPTDQND